MWFSDPHQLNDPIDCNIDLRAAFSRAAKSADGRRRQFFNSAIEHPTLLDNFGTALAHVGVCAFSLSCKETLMWSHYADQHRGVCILYRFPPEFVQQPENKILGRSKVSYGGKALAEMLLSTSMEMQEFLNALLETYLTTKAPSWRYEREARIIRMEPGLLSIPGEFVEQICFGLRAADSDIDLVVKLAQAYTPCKRFARVVRSSHEYGLLQRPL